MSQNQNLSEDTIDLKELFFSLLVQWKIILLCIILSTICALIYLRTIIPTYSANATVQAQIQNSKITASNTFLGNMSNAVTGDLNSRPLTKEEFQSEINLLKSQKLLSDVISSLSLDIHIQPTMTSALHQILKREQSQLTYEHDVVKFNNNNNQVIVKALNIPAYYIDKPLELNYISANEYTLSHNQEVVFKGKSNQVVIKNDQFGQWEVEIFNQSPLHDSLTVTKHSLASTINQLLNQYNVAETGKNTGIIGLSLTSENKEFTHTVLNRILEQYKIFNDERSNLKHTESELLLETQVNELRKDLLTSEIAFNNYLQKNNIIDAQQSLESLAKQDIELSKLKVELQQSIKKMKQNHDDHSDLFAVLNTQLDEVNQKIVKLNQTVQQLPEKNKLYITLYHDVHVNTERYNSLLETHQNLRVNEVNETPVKLLDFSVAQAEKNQPKKLIILVLAILFGGFIGVVIALLKGLMRSDINDSLHVENTLKLPVYTTVPRSTVNLKRIRLTKKAESNSLLALTHPDDIAIESLRSIRTAIRFALNSAKNNVIMISGPTPKVGKSFISSNLAAVFAQMGSRVLIIDADLRRGYVHKYFSLDAQPGLSDYLNEECQLDQVVHSTQIAGLSVITRGKNPTNPSELLSSPRFKALLDQLSTQFDYVIIDTPPILAVTDGVIISEYIGMNLVVARYAKTHMQQLETTIKRFEHAGAKVDGIVLNDIQPNAIDYNYGYNYAYAYKTSKDHH